VCPPRNSIPAETVYNSITVFEILAVKLGADWLRDLK
jgi:hypothetical protein